MACWSGSSSPRKAAMSTSFISVRSSRRGRNCLCSTSSVRRWGLKFSYMVRAPFRVDGLMFPYCSHITASYSVFASETGIPPPAGRGILLL